MLRTGYKTEADQDRFYWQHCYWPWWRRLLAPREHHYFAVTIWDYCVGIAGLTYLSRVPGEAEISLVLAPTHRRRGFGTQAVSLVLQEAWAMGLSAVTGECYPFGNVTFWRKQAESRGATFTRNAQGSWVWKWVRPA